MVLNVHYNKYKGNLGQMVDYTKFYTSENLGKGRAEPNACEKTGNLILGALWKPVKMMSKSSDPKVMIIGAAAAAMFTVQYLLYPDATGKLAGSITAGLTKAFGEMTKNLPAPDYRLVTALVVNTNIIGYSLRGLGRSFNTDLVAQFEGGKKAAKTEDEDLI